MTTTINECQNERKLQTGGLSSVVEHMLRRTKILVQALHSSKQENLIKAFFKLFICI